MLNNLTHYFYNNLGWLDNAGSFDTLIPLLPKNLRIVALDTIGHGMSDHLPPDLAYNFLDFLVAIERIAGLLKWSKFSFLAHSLGQFMYKFLCTSFCIKYVDYFKVVVLQ